MVLLSQARGHWAGRPNLDLIAKKCNLGDWFLIYHLGRNMEPMVYGEFLKEFAKELENSVSTLTLVADEFHNSLLHQLRLTASHTC